MGVVRKRHYSGGGFARKFLRAGAAGLRLAMRYRYGGNGSRTQTGSRKSRDYGNITYQNDEHTIYRRKRAPKRVRRRHRKVFKNFMYNMDKLQSMKTAVITGFQTVSNTPTTAANAQVATGVSIYGYSTNNFASNTEPRNGDIPYIFARENGAYPTTALGSRKLRFRSAVMDITVQNILVGNEAESLGGILNLDVYHVLCRKDGTGTSDFVTQWNAAVDEQAAGNLVTAITSYQYDGVTPFDAPGFCSRFVIKRVRKIRLSPGQTFQTQMRDPGNYVLNMNDILEKSTAGNLTEGYIILGYNPAVNTTTGVRGICSFTLNYRKKYHYTETSSSVDSIGS